MRAMIFEQVGEPLRAVELEKPSPGRGELLLRVHACGVCRTDLHLLAPEVPVKTRVSRYALEDANEALADLRAGRFTGAAVIVP